MYNNMHIYSLTVLVLKCIKEQHSKEKNMATFQLTPTILYFRAARSGQMRADVRRYRTKIP